MAIIISNSDLQAKHNAILSYGPTDWSDKIFAASAIVERDIDLRWYRKNFSRDVDGDFDMSRVDDPDNRIRDIMVYKTLTDIFEYLTKGPDNFLELYGLFRERYLAEIKTLLETGLDYDTDASGVVEEIESAARRGPRKLVRG